MTSTFGPYQLIRKLAQGGMAEVFLASRQGEIGGFSKQVAIKRIYEHLAEDPELITMFFDEGRIAARLNHSNIVQIYDLGQIDGCFYIAMEFVNGCDLRSLCERGLKASNFLPLPMAVKIAAASASGLHYAHTRVDEHGRPLNIVHRDVSPQNILISMDGDIKVCDFGIAKAEARMTQTQTGQFKGKFAYMSPEQVLGDGGVIDRRSDIFSLGIILYEITVCTRLFKGKNDYDTIRMVAEADVRPPTMVRQGFPPDLERIILKALSRSPDHRYQTAEEMQMELEEWLLEHRAKTSPVHVSRYMHQIFPELSSRAAPEPWSTDMEQPTMQEDLDATYENMQSASLAAEYADAEATGEIDVNAFRAALENDQSVQDAYNQAAGFKPIPQKSIPKPQPMGQSTQQISTQWSSNAPAPDFSEEGAGATRITQVDPSQDAMTSAYSPSQPDPSPQQTRPAPEGLQQESSGQWQGPDSYAQSSGHWSSVPRDQVASPPQPVQQQPRPVQPQPVQPQPVAHQHAHQHQHASQPQQPMPAAVQPVPQPSYNPAPAAVQPSMAHLHQETAQPASTSQEPDSAWDVQGTSLSMKHDLQALQKGSQRKKIFYALGVFLAVGAVIAVIAVVGIDRPPAELSDANKPIDEALLEVEPPKPLARTAVSIQTEPEGAHVSINGLMAEETTPARFELVEGQPNELIFFLPGHATRRVILDAGKLPDGETITLEKADDVDPDTRGSIEVISEPLGALVFHNGEQMGPAPVTLSNLDPEQLHHVQVVLKDHYNYEALVHPIAGEQDKIRALLDPMSSQSRKFQADLSLETLPRGATVLIDGEIKGMSPTLFRADRHKVYRIRYEANNYHAREHILETSDAGTVMLRPRLRSMTREKGKITLALPSSTQDVYVGPNQYKIKELKNLELKEGTYAVVIITDGGDRHEANLEVIPNTSTNYKFEVLNGSARVRKVK